MDRFVGRYEKRVDAKGRASVPASFRAVLARDGFDQQFFGVRALAQPAIECGGEALIGEIDATLSTFETFSPEYEELSTALLGAGETISLDPEGRFVMPKWMREAMELGEGGQDLIFVGQGKKFQIWGNAPFAAFEAAARARARELLRRPAAKPEAAS